MTAVRNAAAAEMQREADEAVRVLREGGLILYPTDTVWGIGCDTKCSARPTRPSVSCARGD